jgi:hypothetical protein
MSTALATLISIAGLMAIVFWPYDRFRIDRLRHDLFRLRNGLCQSAANGEISFQSPAYQNTRLMLNGMIRFAHKVSLVRFVSGSLLMSKSDVRRIHIEVGRMFDGATPSERELCQTAIRRANLCVAYHLMTSPFMLVLVAPLFLVVVQSIGRRVTDSMVKMYKSRFETMDGIFYREVKLQNA